MGTLLGFQAMDKVAVLLQWQVLSRWAAWLKPPLSFRDK